MFGFLGFTPLADDTQRVDAKVETTRGGAPCGGLALATRTAGATKKQIPVGANASAL